MANFQGGMMGYPQAGMVGGGGPGMVPGAGGGWQSFSTPQTWAGIQSIGSENVDTSALATQFSHANMGIQNFINANNIRIGFMSAIQEALAQSESFAQTATGLNSKITKGWAQQAQNAV